jgi:hypothetical protein
VAGDLKRTGLKKGMNAIEKNNYHNRIETRKGIKI